VSDCPGDHFNLEAKTLYALFRQADKQTYSAVLILEEGIQEDAAVWNRLSLAMR